MDDQKQDKPHPRGPSPLGQFVRARREERGLSQQAIGRALGTSHSIISRLESKNNYSINKRHLLALARILDVPIETLLELEGLRASQPGRPRPDQQEAINLVLQMDAAKVRLARGLLRTLLEDGMQPVRVRRREESEQPVS